MRLTVFVSPVFSLLVPLVLFFFFPPALSHLLWLYSHRMPPLPGNKLTVTAGAMAMHPFLFGRVKKKMNSSL
jgi:hypothetical protein